MAWLIYVCGIRGPVPQLVFDGDNKPAVTDGIRGLVVPGSERRLTAIEATLSLHELEARYPAPCTSVPA